MSNRIIKTQDYLMSLAAPYKIVGCLQLQLFPALFRMRHTGAPARIKLIS
jgi:hypothetical protein